jgi:DNA (cytosine-5)-methyltransferase 1
MSLTAESVTVPSVSSRYHWEGGNLYHSIEAAGHHARTFVAMGTADADSKGEWWRAYLRGMKPEVAESSYAGRTVRTIELFCGPGGLALGFEQACAELGLRSKSLAAVDQDIEAVSVYRKNHDTQMTTTESVSSLVDYQIRGTRGEARFHYEPELIKSEWRDLAGCVDVILAGPPCQGHSNLNNQSRRTDRRNDLYLTVPAIAVAVGAPVVIIENVPSVVHDRLGVVAATIALLEDAGYTVTTGVLNAAKMGWPQTRSRFFLVARRDTAPFEIESVSASLADEPRSILWALEGLEDLSGGHFMEAQAEFSEENLRRIDWLFDNEMYDLSLSERPECHQEGTTYKAVYGRLHPDRPAPTITTGFMTPGRGRYIHPTRRRVLTPREAARLQGFPDTYDFQPNPPAVPFKTKLGKWIGDAVPMPLGYGAGLAAIAPGWGG